MSLGFLYVSFEEPTERKRCVCVRERELGGREGVMCWGSGCSRAPGTRKQTANAYASVHIPSLRTAPVVADREIILVLV